MRVVQIFICCLHFIILQFCICRQCNVFSLSRCAKLFKLYGCSFAQRCILKKQSRTFLTDQREVNRTKTRKNMFFLIIFGFYHVFLTGRTAAKKQHTVSTVQVEIIFIMIVLINDVGSAHKINECSDSYSIVFRR